MYNLIYCNLGITRLDHLSTGMGWAIGYQQIGHQSGSLADPDSLKITWFTGYLSTPCVW